ncbi:MAG: nitroreductase family protein [Mobilitalea sp.]
MELFDVIKVRRSARKFKDIAITDRILDEMLEAARLAPSPGNSQGYYFGVVKDKTIKEKLAKAAGEQMWIATAPIVFACCADLSWDIADQAEDDFGLIVNKLRFNNDFIKYICEYPDRKARTTLLENATPLIPGEHIFLTAAAHGLNACFVGYLDIAEADRILQLPQHITCLFLLPVGYTDELPKEKHLKELSEIVFYDHWSK